jgi:hypothetical protein
MNGNEMPGGAWLGFELLAETNDVRIDGAGVGEGFVAPDRIQNDVAFEDAVRVLKEERQQVVFGWREFERFALAGDHAPFEIDFGIGKTDGNVGIRRGTAEDSVDAREKFARTEGFDDIVVGADFEEKDFVHFLADGAEDDQWSLDAGGAELLADLNAAHAGEAEVDEDQIGFMDESAFEAGLAVGGLQGAKTIALQHKNHSVTKVLVIVDYEDGAHISEGIVSAVWKWVLIFTFLLLGVYRREGQKV